MRGPLNRGPLKILVTCSIHLCSRAPVEGVRPRLRVAEGARPPRGRYETMQHDMMKATLADARALK